MFRFTIRELLLVATIVGLLLAWKADHSLLVLQCAQERQRAEKYHGWYSDLLDAVDRWQHGLAVK
jgi:hypothetical protein